MQVKQCRHGRLMFYDNDLYIGRCLHQTGLYSEEEIQLWDQIIRPGWHVIDVGANLGAHTVWFAKAVGKSGQVYAFEPQRQMYQMLLGNLALNEITNTNVMLAAVGDDNRVTRVRPIDYAAETNFGGVFVECDAGPEVPLVKIDSLGIARADFIKVDVEGMEAAVLRGAMQTIVRCNPVLYLENDRTEKSDELVALVRELGYQPYKHHPVLNAEVFGNQIVSFNMLCVRPGTKVVGLQVI